MEYAVAEINDLVMVTRARTGKRIEHEIDEIIWCNEYQPMKSKDDKIIEELSRNDEKWS